MKVRAIAILAAFVCVTTAGSALAAAPAKPAEVRRERVSPTEVLITWEDRSGNEDGFEILRRRPANPDFESRGTVGPNITAFLDEADKGDLYIYRVRAFNEDGDSDFANDCFVGKNPPVVPINFKVRLIALTVVRVSWSDRSNGETGFLIQRAEEGKGFETIATVDANTEAYEDNDLRPATLYTYRLRALGRPVKCIDHSKFTVERTISTKGGVKTLDIDLTGNGTGFVRSIPDGIYCGPNADHCSAEFPNGTDVTLIAEPNAKSRFKAWLEVPKCEDVDGPCTFNMGQNRAVGVLFKKRRLE